MLSDENRKQLIRNYIREPNWFAAALAVFPEEPNKALKVTDWARKNVKPQEIDEVRQAKGTHYVPTKDEAVSLAWQKMQDPHYREQFPLIFQQISKIGGWDAPTNTNINITMPRVMALPTINGEAEWEKLAVADFKKLTSDNVRDAEEI